MPTQSEPFKPTTSICRIGVLVDHAVPGEDRMHAILDRRAHPHQRDPMAQYAYERWYVPVGV
jgi:hypothetical protein